MGRQGPKPKQSRRLGNVQKEQIDKLLEEGATYSHIMDKTGVTFYSLKKYIDEKDTLSGDSNNVGKGLAGIIAKNLEKDGNFGKLDEKTRKYIKLLYKEGIPSQIVAEFLGLNHAVDEKYAETGGFFEKTELNFQDECKHAQAEAQIRLIMAATTDLKPIDALRFLEKNENTRKHYKAPKEEKSAIKIEFPGFSREVPINPEVKKPEDLN